MITGRSWFQMFGPPKPAAAWCLGQQTSANTGMNRKLFRIHTKRWVLRSLPGFVSSSRIVQTRANIILKVHVVAASFWILLKMISQGQFTYRNFLIRLPGQRLTRGQDPLCLPFVQNPQNPQRIQRLFPWKLPPGPFLEKPNITELWRLYKHVPCRILDMHWLRLDGSDQLSVVFWQHLWTWDVPLSFWASGAELYELGCSR